MKKSFIVTLGLAAFAVGAFAGVKSNVKEVKAATETTIYCAISEEKLGGNTLKANVNFKGDGDDWHTFNMLKLEETYESMLVYSASFTDAWDGIGCLQFQIWGENWIEQDTVINWSWTSPSVYNGKLWVYGSTGWNEFTPASVEYHAVTLYGVYDDVLNDEPLNQSNVIAGTVYEPSDRIEVNYHFGGWYLDEGLTQEYVPAALEADLVLYAKYTTFNTYLGGVVYITEAKDIFTHVYFFGEFEPAPWPGLRLEDLVEDDVVTEKGYAQEISNNGLLHFNGLSQKMFLIPAPSTTDANYKMILNNGSDEQTVDMDVVDYAGLYVYRDAPEGKWDYSMNTDAGLAAVFVSSIDNNRNNVKANEEEGIKAYSICGLEKSYAATMVDAYDNQLTDEARKMVNDSTTYTYNKDGSEGESDISFADIVAQLRINANKDAVASSNRSVDPAATSMGVLIAAAACVTLLGACIIIRKKVRA